MITPSESIWSVSQSSTFKSNETLAASALVETVKGVTDISTARSALPAATAEPVLRPPPPVVTVKVTPDRVRRTRSYVPAATLVDPWTEVGVEL